MTEKKTDDDGLERALREAMAARCRAKGLKTVAQEMSCSELTVAMYCANLNQRAQTTEWLRKRAATLLLRETKPEGSPAKAVEEAAA